MFLSEKERVGHMAEDLREESPMDSLTAEDAAEPDEWQAEVFSETDKAQENFSQENFSIEDFSQENISEENASRKESKLPEDPDSKSPQSEDVPHLVPEWFIVHTYSGYENKVKLNIEKTIKNLDRTIDGRRLEDWILEVRVPLEDVTEFKNGVRKEIQRKLYPGYVFLRVMVSSQSRSMNDDIWYIVRNTRGVTGFVGPGSKPIPLTKEEINALLKTKKEIELDFEPGDTVELINAGVENMTGVVASIDKENEKVYVYVSYFAGRETEVELSFSDVRKI